MTSSEEKRFYSLFPNSTALARDYTQTAVSTTLRSVHSLNRVVKKNLGEETMLKKFLRLLILVRKEFRYLADKLGRLCKILCESGVECILTNRDKKFSPMNYLQRVNLCVRWSNHLLLYSFENPFL